MPLMNQTPVKLDVQLLGTPKNRKNAALRQVVRKLTPEKIKEKCGREIYFAVIRIGCHDIVVDICICIWSAKPMNCLA